ncbi:hypothetical protein GUJ93_ZPchr0008g13781 [Zizania palustris]|uniref:Uncharacterized protein n=1 Tax=Zizania palustris TaxID=103762 RepID=A0A8J5QZ41_ZIZPA|nr:hypothetical protein GUJ93_ZPchr0008g13781 [Zizania palustris]
MAVLDPSAAKVYRPPMATASSPQSGNVAGKGEEEAAGIMKVKTGADLERRGKEDSSIDDGGELLGSNNRSICYITMDIVMTILIDLQAKIGDMEVEMTHMSSCITSLKKQMASPDEIPCTVNNNSNNFHSM